VNRCLSYGDEVEWFDFKDSIFKPDEIGEYISALSNAAAMGKEAFGYLIWGIHNDTHGFTNTKFNYQKDVNHEPLQHYLSRYVSPKIYFHFDEDFIDGNRVVVLTIPAARIVPTEYRDVRYIRIGSSKEKLKRFPDREAALFKVLLEKQNPTDEWESSVSRYRIDEIDRAVFDEYLQKAKDAGRITFKSSTPEAVLNKLELTDNDHLLNAGAALFVDCGINELQMAKFATDERVTFNDIKRFTGSILDLVDKAVQYIADTMDWRVEFDGSLERKEYPEIPVDAVREAVVNAFGHRLVESKQAVEVAIYKSFIDIYSPGIFPENVEPEQFVDEELKPIRRNPLIARTLYYSKDMESFATGLKRISASCKQAGVRYEFKREPYGFTVRFYRHCGKGWEKDLAVLKKQPEKQPEKQPNTRKSDEIEKRAAAVIKIIKQNPYISRREIADSLGITVTQVRTAIYLLKQRNSMYREGSDNGGYWVVTTDDENN
jgi:ATP-dependent DNA helicase RecG